MSIDFENIFSYYFVFENYFTFLKLKLALKLLTLNN